jgi:hypothetical protein
MNNPLTGVNEHRASPLCRSYLLVLFESVPVALQADDGVCSGQRLHWALGVLPDGDNEVLGAWTASQSDGPAWNKVFEELAGRGVERIEFLVVGGLAPAQAERALRDEYPNAILLPSEMDKGTLTLGANAQAPVTSFAMSAGHYRQLVAADEAVQNLQRLACRAIERHGTFSEPTGASTFVLDRLHRANQKTDGGLVPYGVASEVLTGPSTRRRRGARIAAPSL